MDSRPVCSDTESLVARIPSPASVSSVVSAFNGYGRWRSSNILKDLKDRIFEWCIDCVK